MISRDILKQLQRLGVQIQVLLYNSGEKVGGGRKFKKLLDKTQNIMLRKRWSFDFCH
jgi:hypothetical protein